MAWCAVITPSILYTHLCMLTNVTAIFEFPITVLYSTTALLPDLSLPLHHGFPLSTCWSSFPLPFWWHVCPYDNFISIHKQQRFVARMITDIVEIMVAYFKIPSQHYWKYWGNLRVVYQYLFVVYFTTLFSNKASNDKVISKCELETIWKETSLA
jgi:hypothetical protein